MVNWGSGQGPCIDLYFVRSQSRQQGEGDRGLQDISIPDSEEETGGARAAGPEERRESAAKKREG